MIVFVRKMDQDFRAQNANLKGVTHEHIIFFLIHKSIIFLIFLYICVYFSILKDFSKLSAVFEPFQFQNRLVTRHKAQEGSNSEASCMKAK